jgi:2-polyprenyl-3-methyl-5-hydroxy-6-metoxy-1,4-benzoquinol methylase
MIHEIEYDQSKELVHELESIKEYFQLDNVDTFIGNISSIEDYYKRWMDDGGYSDLITLSKTFSQSLKIMDVGVGSGTTSTYLAHQGHHVTAIEPSMPLCLVMQELSSRFNLNMSIYSCSAEAIGKISESDYDICIFNSSLHHCDKPVTALKACFDKLRSGGKIYLLSELRLPFYVSKEKFQQKLLTDPISMGHYGGNEHAYRYHEYVDMLKQSGFAQVTEFLPVNYLQPRNIIRARINQKIDGQYIYSDSKLIVRYVYYFCLSKIVSNSFLINLLIHLSLIDINFESVKPS